MQLDNITVTGKKYTGEPQSQQQEEQPAQAEESKQEPIQEDTKPQEQPPASEPTKTETKVKAEEPTPTFDVKEKTNGAYDSFDALWNDFQEAKNAKPEATGYEPSDDFIKGAIEYYEKTGDLTPYLEAKTVDYDSLSDEAILKKSMREEYPSLDDKTFNRLFEKQLQKEYTLDPDEYSEEDVELGKALMQNKAQKLREKYKESQAKFAAPTNDQAAKQQELAEQWTSMVTENDYVKNLQKDGKVQFQYGDEKFTYELDNPKEIVDGMIDESKIFQNFIDQKDGKQVANFDRYAKTLAFSKDPDGIIQRAIEYGQSLGKGDVLNELENPTEIKTPNRKQPGVSGSGDWKEDFFQQIKGQRKK